LGESKGESYISRRLKRVLVFGGAGFIGTNICKKLLLENFFVTCYDNFSSGKKKNIDNIDSDNFEIIEGDICKEISLKNNYEYIINLACPASPKYYLSKPIDTALASTVGILNILNFTRENKKTILLHSSTSEVYGDPLSHPQSENYFGNVNMVGPRSCYDESKRMAETFIYEYHKNYNMNTKIIRIFNTYGPYMHHGDGRVVSNFVNQALAGDNITIYGDGKQTRSFCFIDDLIEGILDFLFLDKNYLGPINLGNPNELNMNDLAEKIISLTNSKSKISFKSLPENDPQVRKPDISLAKELINFNPKIDLESGLKETIAYFSKK